MEGENNNLTKEHPQNLKGIFKAYPFKKIIESKSFRLAVITTALYLVIIIINNIQYDQIVILTDIYKDVFPSLLGFNLGGYAVIISFGNVSLLKAMTKKVKNKDYSLYQLISGIFAFSILLQALVVVMTFMISLILTFPTPGFYSILCCDTINTVVVAALFFFGIYSLFQLPKMVINVFNFGQLHHFNLVKEKILSNQNRKM